jgi:site-specific recombinase XerD
MLSIYRRHTSSCTAKRQQHDRSYWKCNCTIYAEGAIGRRYIRQSLKTRSREEAHRRIVEAEARGAWDVSTKEMGKGSVPRTAADAIAAFLEDAASTKGRELATATLGKYRTLFGRLQSFCSERSLSRLDDLTTEALRTFRETWPTGPRATSNNICRLKAFFKFCVENEWIARNPALPLRAPKHIRDTQKLPFSDGEMRAILMAARSLPFPAVCNAEIEALILLMRHAGLRISDAVFLTADRIVDGELRLHMQKTGSYVSIPLPNWLIDTLGAIAPKQPNYLFITGSTRLETATDLWRRKLSRVFHAAGLKNATPHRFRHTFAVDLLTKGVDIKTVSLLLGHSSVTITERFYSAWVTGRQQALSDQIRRTWADQDLAA